MLRRMASYERSVICYLVLDYTNFRKDYISLSEYVSLQILNKLAIFSHFN